MKKITANVVFSLFLIFVFIGSGFLNLFADNDKAGLLAFIILPAAYIGYYLVIMHWGNPYLQENAPFPHFIKWAFIFQLCMGILLLAHLMNTPSSPSVALSLFSDSYDQYASEYKVKRNLGIISCIILIAPFFIRKIVQVYNS